MVSETFGDNFKSPERIAMRNELNMTLEGLAKWFINYHERVRIAKKLDCAKDNPQQHTDWTCCAAHQGLSNEYARMQVVAHNLVPEKKQGQVFSSSWWKEVGQADAARATK